MELKTCHDATRFLRNDQLASLILVIWKHTDYQKKKIPTLYYRLGFYREDDSLCIVGSTPLTRVSIYYFLPQILEDYPAFLINFDNHISAENKWSFLEIYDVENKSIHYIVPRMTSYHNPFQPDETVYTEIVLNEHPESSEKSFLDDVRTTNADFSTFWEQIAAETENSYENKTEKIVLTTDKQPIKVPLFCRKKDDVFGFLWQNEIHWKMTFKQTGYSSCKTALPPQLLLFVDPIIISVGDYMIENMIKSLYYKKVPANLAQMIISDFNPSSMEYCDKEAIKDFCISDITNALLSRRQAINVIHSFFDFNDHFALVTHEGVLDSERTELDPFDPFKDVHVASLFSIHTCGITFASNLQSIMPDLINTEILSSEKVRARNVTKLRIFAGRIISLTRNGKVYGELEHHRPQNTIDYMNDLLRSKVNILHQQKKKLNNYENVKELLLREKNQIKQIFLQGLDCVETTLYFIDHEVVLLSPLFPENMCLYGEWCSRGIIDKGVLDKLLLFPEILLQFYEYNFVTNSLNILQKCYEKMFLEEK